MGWVSRLPIRSKAPVTVAILVLVVGVAISAAAYFVLRRALHDHVAGRLSVLQAQYVETYRNSMANSRARIVEAANRPELIRYLREPQSARGIEAFLTPPGPAPEWVVRMELRDASGGVLVSAPGPAASNEPTLSTLNAVDGRSLIALASSNASTVGYGKLLRDGDAVLFPIVARAGDSAPGFLVVWRRVAATWQASQQVATVIGDEAAAYMVNADGTLWSQSGKPVAGSPDPPVIGGVTTYERAGVGEVLSVAGLMEGTPWVFVFEFPASVVQAPARTFLRSIVWVAPACILLGMLVAWQMSRRLTEPLHELAKAADGIAAGDLSRRASIVRDDELGRLVRSFNSMAAEIEASRTRLEALVEERTRQLRTVEDSLKRREKLALVGQFASSIGHEIRNPLGVMRNAVAGLDAVLPDKSVQAGEFIRILNSQLKLSAKIVDDLLELARSTPPRRERVSVTAIVEPKLQECASSGAAVQREIPVDLPAVNVDPVHAGQVMDNLLTNALQATAGKGLVRVRAATLGGFVNVEVSDTGPGVTAGDETRIFEPLFTTKPRGIGLGLALAKSLAQANGGNLTLASRPGEGARFVFSLPTAVPVGDVRDRPSPASAVEDHTLTRK